MAFSFGTREKDGPIAPSSIRGAEGSEGDQEDAAAMAAVPRADTDLWQLRHVRRLGARNDQPRLLEGWGLRACVWLLGRGRNVSQEPYEEGGIYGDHGCVGLSRDGVGTG